MTTITAATAATGTTTAASTSSALAKLTSDSNMFLKLLTTQMQNQDPLKPMDTSQYTQQLVQFSQVEQSIQQNQSLKDILAKLSSSDLSNAASMIGHVASFDSSIAALGSAGGASWTYTTDRSPQALVATISDANGNTVSTQAVDPAASSFTWDGTDSQANRASPGAYTLALSATDAAGATIPAAIRAQGQVSEVSLDGGQVSLLVNGQKYAASSLVRLTNAQ
ncbi:flagellar hook capping FlgD N-terminal domain-containing protein [Sphingomonas sp. TREG-RG-20F-R18-01]|uniref:flagellar hook assembly protein FlgD n=1 Tax=Sphingomonas sp. TREG-RG-20F-R18-01 TaxID=2914982 RepID=UPI001F5A5BD1|nr:flagellar hook capping FlgD N-terminal domain-containing protein [Sphingomonas sp. TREG-RG-20F-R18-01]